MIITRAPLRISFFGGGTDYPEYFRNNGGAVLATSIDKYSYVTASRFHSPLFDYHVRLSYRENELVQDVSQIRHNVFRACLTYLHFSSDIELHTVADLPSFTGLGSSSSFTVALLQALHAFRGEFRTPAELAREAIHVERHLLQEAVGCQDQVLAAFGGFNFVEFSRDEQFVVRRVPIAGRRLEEFEQHLVIVFTGIKRSASEVAAQQLSRVEINAPTLAAMRAMVSRAWDIVTGTGDLEEFGALLDEAWLAKRSLDGGISNPTIDELYERGRSEGALGGKLLGAGGGGFMLFFVPQKLRERVRASFAPVHLLDVRLSSAGSQVIFSE
jgi:D-glycero-alpha-D-manno-heptose-7-phosphate kinase